jgi:catechol 2,3-dioxygenase
MPGISPDAHVGRVRLRVADLERSLELYRDVLGFEVSGRAHGLVALSSPSDDAGEGEELIVLEEHPGIARRPSRPVTTGLYHVALLLPSRAVLGAMLQQFGRTEYRLRGASDHGVSESLYLDDPDGNGLEIYADRPRERWPMRDGSIEMSIDPMDMNGVLGEAGNPDRAWRLPSGTRVGHVHFTVSSLKDAEAFYCGALGLDVTQRTLVGVLAVSAGGYHHHVNLNVWAGPNPGRDSEKVAGLIEWELVMSSERARADVEQRLESGGYAFQRDTEVVRAADPDGNIVVVRAVSARSPRPTAAARP